MDWALCIAMVAIIATIYTTISSSRRSEAHHQSQTIQGITKELSELIHQQCKQSEASKKTPSPVAMQINSLLYEVIYDLKCDQLESSLELLARRCKRKFLFDADSSSFRHDMIGMVSRLRDELSKIAHHRGCAAPPNLHAAHAILQNVYGAINDYIGERFRPVIE